MKRQLCLGLAALAFFALVNVAAAADDAKALAGKWKFTVMQGNNMRDVTITIKADGDKLTASIPGRMNMETMAKEVSFKNGDVKIVVEQERNNMKTVTTYSGKLSGDTIKGTIETKRGDMEPRKADWEAKKVKE